MLLFWSSLKQFYSLKYIEESQSAASGLHVVKPGTLTPARRVRLVTLLSQHGRRASVHSETVEELHTYRLQLRNMNSSTNSLGE